jgi:hypothetical protein
MSLSVATSRYSNSDRDCVSLVMLFAVSVRPLRSPYTTLPQIYIGHIERDGAAVSNARLLSGIGNRSRGLRRWNEGEETTISSVSLLRSAVAGQTGLLRTLISKLAPR